MNRIKAKHAKTNYDLLTKMNNDLLTYGVSVNEICRRAWYNPMRWVKGPFYIKTIPLRDIKFL